MSFTPRYYQTEAVDAIFDYWKEEPGHPLVDMATGTGKSGTMAMLNQRLLDGWPDMRIMSVTHVEELIEGNFTEFLGLCPFAPAGIYAASLGRRDRKAQVLFAQLQTVWNKAEEIGHVDVLEIDEVHLVPSDGNTMYRKLIAALLAINPDMKIVGFTATPYRLDSGRLDEGDDRLFDKVVYTYTLSQGIADGYLTRLTSKPTTQRIDMTGVRTLGGEYNKKDLAAASDKEELTRAVVAEVLSQESSRKTAIFFCSGIDHATHMRDEVRRQGKTCEVLTGKTPKGERRKIIEDLRSGRIWGCANDNVLSTGTNIKNIDLIVDTAATKSTNRYVQRAGRGTRVLYAPGFDLETVEGRLAAIAAGPKPDCRYMCFSTNIEYHGPVDKVEPKKPGEKGGDAPIKLCPKCEEINHASARICSDCGHEFEFEEKPRFNSKASDIPIMSGEKPWSIVMSQRMSEHPAKVEGKPNTVKISYMVGFKSINEWACPGHSGFPKSKADRYWLAHNGNRPFPKDAVEWLARAGELKRTAEIQLDYAKNPKYPEIIGHRVADNDNNMEIEQPRAENTNWMDELDDEIPF